MTSSKSITAIGRRKEAKVKVTMKPEGKGLITVLPSQRGTGVDYRKYFPTLPLQEKVAAPLVLTNLSSRFDVEIAAQGGGKTGQADSARLGIARALLKFNPELKAPLRAAGFLTRDPRVKERKKYGLKRARRAPQWQKR